MFQDILCKYLSSIFTCGHGYAYIYIVIVWWQSSTIDAGSHQRQNAVDIHCFSFSLGQVLSSTGSDFSHPSSSIIGATPHIDWAKALLCCLPITNNTYGSV